jgi:N-acyl-D-amino-acid deacylase
MLLVDPLHEPKVRQGVTTEVIGVDGNSYAPFVRREDLEDFIVLNGGLDGRPPIAPDWDSVASYLGRFDGRVAVNIGFLVGNSALRICALGWADRPADAGATARMRSMLAEAMSEGALGVSSGLDYPPGSYADTAELAELAAEATRHGGFYHTHVRYPLGDRFLDPFREALEIGRRAEGAVHITHLYHRSSHPGPPEALLELVDGARAEGRDVTFDTYPFEWASTRLLIQLPQWVQSGGIDALRQRLADAQVRDRIRAELRGPGASYAAGWSDVRLGYFADPGLARWEARTVADIAEETGQEPVDLICDILLLEDLRINQVTSGPSAASLPLFIRHPAGMVGTDSTFLGAKPSPRTYGSFPRILGQFVRDEALLSLEEAVRKMTSAAAARLGIADRGLLRDGMKADVVVFDPEAVRSTATYDAPRSYPVGIEQVIVNGTPVIRDGVHTGALPGRAVGRRRFGSA